MSTAHLTGRYCCADNSGLQRLSICVAMTMVMFGVYACTDTYHVNIICSRHRVMQAGLHVSLAKPDSSHVFSRPLHIMHRLGLTKPGNQFLYLILCSYSAFFETAKPEVKCMTRAAPPECSLKSIAYASNVQQVQEVSVVWGQCRRCSMRLASTAVLGCSCTMR